MVKEEIVYNTTVNNYIQSSKSVNELISEGRVLLDVGQILDAYTKFKSAADMAPGDYRAWLGCARALAVSKTESDAAYEVAYKLANEFERGTVINEWISSMALKDETGFERTYDRLLKICGEGLHEMVDTIWTAEGKRDIALNKEFSAVWYQSSTNVTDGNQTLPGGVYCSPYSLFKIDRVFEYLDDKEQGYIIAGMRTQIKKLEADQEHIIKNSDSGVQFGKKFAEIQKDVIKNHPNSAYVQIGTAIAWMKRFIGEPDASDTGTKEGTKEKKKRFWQR
jgi:hypothetical protein